MAKVQLRISHFVVFLLFPNCYWRWLKGIRLHSRRVTALSCPNSNWMEVSGDLGRVSWRAFTAWVQNKTRLAGWLPLVTECRTTCILDTCFPGVVCLSCLQTIIFQMVTTTDGKRQLCSVLTYESVFPHYAFGQLQFPFTAMNPSPTVLSHASWLMDRIIYPCDALSFFCLIWV